MPSILRLARRLAAALLCLAALAPARAEITGAGATFPSPVYARLAEQYRQATGVEVRYEPVGSGAGVERIARRQVDFAGTDKPLTSQELQRLGLRQFPAVIGGVVPVVNIGGAASSALRLSGEVLGDIYLGRIRKWNDRAITALNPGLALPSSNITVVYRADSSGTSHLWRQFLAHTNKAWSATGEAWPVGVAEMGNEGVASSVQRTRMSIGYVEYAYAVAHRLDVASVRNRDGQYPRPSREAFQAAAAGWDGDAAQPLIDRPGAGSWPIVGASFILVPSAASASTSEALKFLDWALREGASAATSLNYVPLPTQIVLVIEKDWPAR